MPRYRVAVELEAASPRDAGRIARVSLRMAGDAVLSVSPPVRVDTVPEVPNESKTTSEVTLTRATMAAVKGLAKGLTHASEIAEYFGFSHQGIANRLRAMEAEGWIERIPEGEVSRRPHNLVRFDFKLSELGLKRLDELVPGWRDDD